MPRKKYGNAKYFLTSRSALFWAGVAVLGFSVSVLATSTYAWWKLADLLILDKIQVGYNGSEMFKIGMKNSAGEIEYPNYVDMSSDQTIDNSVLSTYSSFTGNEVLRPVSGMYESLWNNASADPATSYPQFRTGFFGAEDVRKAALAPSSSYLQFEFFFVCDRDVYVYLDGSTSLVANHAANEKIAASLDGVTVDELDKVAQCARVSFYSGLGYTIYEPNMLLTSSGTVYAGRLNLTNDDDYYDVADGKEILYGEYTADHLVYDDAGRSTSMSGSGSAFDALSDPKAEAIDFAKSKSEGGLVMAQEKAYTLNQLSSYDPLEHPLAYCPMNVVTRLVMSVYLEGWDTDTIESIGYAKFSLHIGFSGLLKSQN